MKRERGSERMLYVYRESKGQIGRERRIIFRFFVLHL